MPSLPEFRAGERLSASKLNRVVRAVNALQNMVGDGLVAVRHTPAGVAISLNVEQLIGRLPLGGGAAVPGKITAVQEDNTPPCDHQYKAEALDGREIDTFTTPENARDDDVKYVAAAVDDWCLMWWESDGTGHLLVAGEIYDTVEDA